jgi:hypothetical protein
MFASIAPLRGRIGAIRLTPIAPYAVIERRHVRIWNAIAPPAG